MKMQDLRPYMFNAYYSWLSESGCTPHIHVNCNHHGVRVPTNYIAPDGTIILNISMGSAHNLSFDNGVIVFNASFGGKQQRILVPVDSVMTIFAKENPQIGTNLYSPDESAGNNQPSIVPADELVTGVKASDPDDVIVGVKASDPDEFSKESIAEKVERKLKLVDNKHSRGEKSFSDRRANLRVLH